jgi:flagellum-specific peptidoglycan hydrolase FlgJ|uniref:Peptidoglycan hydrolase n=1 Tax=uncultured Flavobacteriia bacterium TaxID=212695 RepID=F4MLQ9_9BACT|nr:mannosyl-glycoprotein endo-beta-N-acetylglucosaminidase, glycoside hydrolase family GH73, carbohydrate-binding module family CBM50 [uncultured bacterium]CBL87072.1 mannosyl-glycoprotein endo-beta-N-acetylglucosamidase [uncultured Flavobacteriia bacterium]
MLKKTALSLISIFILSCSVTKTIRPKTNEVDPEVIPKKEAVVVVKGKVVVKKPIEVVQLSQEQKAQAYIDKFAPIAQDEMRQYQIPASITLAQGILESGVGFGSLAVEGNNHFGIKCHRGWNGGKMYHDDDAKGECFRTYDDPAESYRDHSVFLSGRQRYAFLFKLNKKDYVAWAKGLKKAGYATDPKYPKKIISIIERYKLYKYDSKKGAKIVKNEKIDMVISKNKKNNIHRVEVGDTLYSIAYKYSISVDDIVKENKLENSTIYKGQELIIPKSK